MLMIHNLHAFPNLLLYFLYGKLNSSAQRLPGKVLCHWAISTAQSFSFFLHKECFVYTHLVFLQFLLKTMLQTMLFRITSLWVKLYYYITFFLPCVDLMYFASQAVADCPLASVNPFYWYPCPAVSSHSGSALGQVTYVAHWDISKYNAKVSKMLPYCIYSWCFQSLAAMCRR